MYNIYLFFIAAVNDASYYYYSFLQFGFLKKNSDVAIDKPVDFVWIKYQSYSR